MTAGPDGDAGSPPRRAPAHWFERLADHMGPAYLRYSFTRGTVQEVDFLVAEVGLAPGAVVVDIGCGPGRHAHELARRGVGALGVDIAERFVRLARDGDPGGAAFVRGDAAALPVRPGSADAAISLCQGGFGLTAGAPGAPARDDAAVVAEAVRAVRRGGFVVISAFSAYFQVRYLEDGDTFDVERGVNHERTEVRDEAGTALEVDLWTGCFTPRELRLLAAAAGLDLRGPAPVGIWSVAPGDYALRPPDLDHPELLLVGRVR